jgi:hypothetical protein
VRKHPGAVSVRTLRCFQSIATRCAPRRFGLVVESGLTAFWRSLGPARGGMILGFGLSEGPTAGARMSPDSEQDDLPKILARALRRAWKLYGVVGSATLSEEVARPSLARHLVRLVKEEGVTDEGPLVAAGLRHLISLANSPLSSKTLVPKENEDGRIFKEAGRLLIHFRVVNARARFIPEWRIRGRNFLFQARSASRQLSERIPSPAPLRHAPGSSP